METYNFRFPLLLTAYHFLMTFGLLELFCCLGVIKRAENVPKKTRWILGTLSVGGVLFMNMNLNVNSVGFYQLSKLCCIPFIVVYDYLTEGKMQPWTVIASLVVLLVGVGLFSVSDVQLRPAGAVIAAIAVVLTSISQKQMGSLQHLYEVRGAALQHSSAFQQFVIALISGLILELRGDNSILHHKFVFREALVIIMTGFIALSVNVCGFALLGKTGPISYQVVGHAKSILIFVFGHLIVPQKIENRERMIMEIVGLVIAMVGIIIYSILKIQQNQPPQKKEEYVQSELLESILSEEEGEEEKCEEESSQVQLT